MSEYKNTVLFSEAGSVPEEELVAKLMDENKSLCGFATALLMVDDTDPKNPTETQVLEIETATGADFPSLADVMKQLEAYSEDDAYLILGDYPKNFSPDSEQPFVILRADPKDDDSDPILIALIDGEIPAHSANGADGAVIVADILRGTLGRFMTTAETMEDLIESIQTDPAIPRMLKGVCGDAYSITMLAENGETWTWGENPLKEEFPGGWISHGMKKSVVEQAKEAATAVTKRVSRTFGGGSKGAGAKAAAGDKTAASAGSLQPAAQTSSTVLKTSNAGGADDAAYIMVAPGKDVTKDNRRTFYKQLNAGHVPSGFKNDPAPEIKVLRATWDKWVVANGIKFGITTLAAVEPVAQTGKVTEVIPKAPPAELKLHKDVFMKRPTIVNITNEGRGIIDPKRQQEMEKEYATYAEIAGLKDIRDVFAYDNADILDLIQKTPTIAMILVGNLIGYCIEHTDADELNPAAEEQPEAKATGTDNKSASQSVRPTPRKAAGVRTFGSKK